MLLVPLWPLLLLETTPSIIHPHLVAVPEETRESEHSRRTGTARARRRGSRRARTRPGAPPPLRGAPSAAWTRAMRAARLHVAFKSAGRRGAVPVPFPNSPQDRELERPAPALGSHAFP